MLRHRNIVVLFLAGCTSIVITVTLFCGPDPQPSFRGASLQGWLSLYVDRYAEDPDATETKQATEAIREIGDKAFPTLLSWMRYEEPPWRRRLQRLLSQFPSPWAEALAPGLDRLEIRAALAAKAFKALGCHGSNAVPALIHLVIQTNAPDTTLRAAMALASTGKPALPALLSTLTNQQLANRDLAAYALANMDFLGTEATPAVSVLLTCLMDPDVDLAETAALALGEIALQPSSVVPALTNKLMSPEQRLRERAAYSLAGFGPAAGSAVPVLRSALGDQDAKVRSAAAHALTCIAPETPTNAAPRGPQ